MPVQSWKSMMQDAAKAEAPKGFEPLPEDIYNFVIKDAGSVSNYSGVDQISARATVEDGPQSGKSEFINFRLPNDNPTVLRIVFEQFAAMGLGEDYFAAEPPLDQVAQQLAGRRFTARVVHTKAKDWETSKKIFVNFRDFKPGMAPSAGPGMAGPGAGGPGMAGPGAGGPGGPGMGAPAMSAPPIQAAPPVQQVQQAAPAVTDPWNTAASAQAAPAPAAVVDPWNTAAAQQPQVPAQTQAPAQAQAQGTWQPPQAPTL